MKHLLLILTFTLFSHADYLNTKSNNICIYDLEPYQDNSGWCYTERSDDSDTCDRRLDMDDLIDGYEYKDDECNLKNDLKLTGLTQSQWSSFMALLANILGFTMFFLVNYIAVIVAKK